MAEVGEESTAPFVSSSCSASSSGNNPQANEQMITQQRQRIRPLEVSEEDHEPRAAKRVSVHVRGSTGLRSLKENDADSEKTSSSLTGSNNPGDDLPDTAYVSYTEQDVAASNEGIKFYSVNDVLCGRGGGTNVHPGNRRFRDLVNANRRAYLKAKKNDKPAISRSIVRAIREMNGRFLKKDEEKDLWIEIGDDCAREKTSQALRQRAPEMRKILLEDEHQQQVEQHMLMQRQQLMAIAAGGGMGGNFPQMNVMAGIGGFNPFVLIDNQSMVQGVNANNNSDLSQSLFAKYNILQQENWRAQEQNMIFQRLAMSGLNPQSMYMSQNNMETMATQSMLQQGLTSVMSRGA